MNLYKPTLKQAWLLTWKNKYLWIFGLFASLVGGGIEFEVINNFVVSSRNIFYWDQFFKTGIFTTKGFSTLINLFTKDTYSFIALFFIFIAILTIIFIVFYISTVSQIAIINNVNSLIKNEKGKNSEECGFKYGIKSGKKHFWKVLVLNLFVKAFIYTAFIIITLPIIYTNGIMSNVFYFIGFVILVPLSMIIAFMTKYISGYVTIYKMNLKEGIRTGFELFKKNWIISTEMTFVLFLITIFSTILIVMVATSLFVPFGIIAVASKLIISTWLFVFILILSIIVPFLLIIIGGSIITTFTTAAWTNLFIKLNSNEKTESKIERTFSKLKK